MRRTGIATYNIHAVNLTGKAHAGIEFLDMLKGEALAHTQPHSNLTRGAVHGVYIAEVNHRSLVAEVFQGHVREVEVYVLQQHISGYEYLGFGI